MGNGYIVYLLRMLAQQQAVASLYCDPSDPDNYQAAFVEQVNARHVLVAAITPWGMLDGWWVRRTSDVLQVLCGEEQETRLSFLLEHRAQRHAPLLPPDLPEDTDWMRAVLDYAIAEGKLVSLFTATETFTCIPRQVDDLRATVQALDLLGQPDGAEEVLPLRDIEALSIGTEEEKMYDILKAHFPAQEIQPTLQ
ncbi:MAG: hypothetical protein LBU67_10710 [Oscillospiraceae bacterium]|jgi:hypothetical protein|nr:hypothetical protein [Oscillospiraceae bacterium]